MQFKDLGLNAPILRALKEQGYDKPSPIQEKAIPPAIEGAFYTSLKIIWSPKASV